MSKTSQLSTITPKIYPFPSLAHISKYYHHSAKFRSFFSDWSHPWFFCPLHPISKPSMSPMNFTFKLDVLNVLLTTSTLPLYPKPLWSHQDYCSSTLTLFSTKGQSVLPPPPQKFCKVEFLFNPTVLTYHWLAVCGTNGRQTANICWMTEWI